jgi:hypothetical protein
MINLNKGLHWKPEKRIGLKNSNQHYKHKLVVNQTPITTFTSLKGSNTNQTQDSKTYQTPYCIRLQALFTLDNHVNSAKIQPKNLIRVRQKIQLATNHHMKLWTLVTSVSLYNTSMNLKNFPFLIPHFFNFTQLSNTN